MIPPGSFVNSIMPIGHAQPCSSMNKLLEQSDFVSLHISSLDENINLIGREEISRMKPKSFLINTSFGKAVDHLAVKEMIESGHLQGAAFDAYPEHYEQKFVSPLQNLRNVILTPHYGIYC